ncbi:MAG TPA: hypothetical protein VG099_14840 [Gemmataceae bacterium]|nr:hypothetical protein [Gemmataceae bacterium]
MANSGRQRNKCANQAQRVQRLTGFCLLVRREVLDKIGGFDGRFGLGFCDDQRRGENRERGEFRQRREF